jgi:hypothetical protein
MRRQPPSRLAPMSMSLAYKLKSKTKRYRLLPLTMAAQASTACAMPQRIPGVAPCHRLERAAQRSPASTLAQDAPPWSAKPLPGKVLAMWALPLTVMT